MSDVSAITALEEGNSHAQWNFAQTVKNCPVNTGPNDPPKNDRAGNRLAAGKFLLVAELNILGNTRCKTCSGFGHTHRECPTGPRITQVAGSNAVMKSIVSQARKTLEISNHQLRAKGLL